jgi:cytidine deaminase
MEKRKLNISYEAYASVDELGAADRSLLAEAKACLDDSYSPYSQFKVGCAIKLANGEVVTGTNQENASFPVGLCAERVALSAVDALYRGSKIESMAITASTIKAALDVPISPCGNCRQAISQAQMKSGNAIRIILQGETGEVFIFNSIDGLLPMSFDDKYL